MEGPWRISDHYLMVQRWHPEFFPFEDDHRKVAVWVRISGLLIEYYDKHILWRMGNCLGCSMHIDSNTLKEKDQGGIPNH